MKLRQLSLFLENKPGHLSAVCEALKNAEINILTLTLADTQQFGILRLIVREWEEAKRVLEEAGLVVNVTEMVAIQVTDRPGGLYDILQILESANINIEYMYAFTAHEGDDSILVFRFNDPDAAIKVMQEEKIHIVASAEMYEKGMRG